MAHRWHAKNVGFATDNLPFWMLPMRSCLKSGHFRKAGFEEYVKMKKAALSGSRYKTFKIVSYASATTDTNDLFARPFLNNTVPGTSANKV